MPRQRWTIFAICFAYGLISSFSGKGTTRGGEPAIHLRVIDSDTGDPLAARLYLKSNDGEFFFFECDATRASAVRYEKQNWINKNSVEYHTTVSADPCFAVVPEGEYRLTVERGKSYFPHHQTVTVGEGNVDLTIRMKRWADPQSRNWFSGDTHLHRTIGELENVIAAEDLNVALPLTNWVTIANRAPRAGDKTSPKYRMGWSLWTRLT